MAEEKYRFPRSILEKPYPSVGTRSWHGGYSQGWYQHDGVCERLDFLRGQMEEREVDSRENSVLCGTVA